jgi:hypothetical protein
MLLLLNIPGNLTLCFYDQNVNHGHMSLLLQAEYMQLACGRDHVQGICDYFPQNTHAIGIYLACENLPVRWKF